jgi:hypothetical protein
LKEDVVTKFSTKEFLFGVIINPIFMLFLIWIFNAFGRLDFLASWVAPVSCIIIPALFFGVRKFEMAIGAILSIITFPIIVVLLILSGIWPIA